MWLMILSIRVLPAIVCRVLVALAVGALDRWGGALPRHILRRAAVAAPVHDSEDLAFTFADLEVLEIEV